MERRLSKKIQGHINTMNDDIKQWLLENNMRIVDVENADRSDMLSTYLGNYKEITFTKEDFLKRKRVKNMAPQHERCLAKRADGSQCTRRKKCEDQYCGTHIKGTPHGTVSADSDAPPTTKNVDVWTEDIKGINYFIDAEKNVYKAEDIMENKQNPNVIGKWEKVDGLYTIPSLNV